MKWEDKFFGHILRRGKDYADRGRVDINFKTPDVCEATVFGSRAYSVSILEKFNGDFDMKCNCPYAKKGNFCKHEAAVMYRWKIGYEQEEVETYPVIEREEDDSLFFDLAKITKEYGVLKETESNVKHVLSKHDLKITQVSAGKYEYYINKEEVVLKGEIRDVSSLGSLFITFVISQEEIKEFSIYGRAYPYVDWGHRFDPENGLLNEYQLAALRLLDQFLLEENPGDYTSRKGMQLIQMFEKEIASQNIQETGGKTNDIKLEPRIIWEYGSLMHLSFKIGKEKMFVVKNIVQLVNNYDNQDSMRLGKNTIISFQTEDFDEKSKRFYDLIKMHLQANGLSDEEHSSYGYSTENKIPLKGVYVDQFYDIAQGMDVELDDRLERKKSKIKMGKENNAIRLTLNEMKHRNPNDKSIKIQMDTEAQFLSGLDKEYMVTKNAFSMLDSNVKPIIQALRNDYYDRSGIVIGKKMLPEFIYRILPKIKEIAGVEVEENIPGIMSELPQEAQLISYLDVEDDLILCRALVQYGEKEYSLLEPMNSSSRSTRDPYQESRFKDVLKRYFPMNGNQNYTCYKSDDEIYALLSTGLAQLMVFGQVHTTKAFDRLRLRRLPAIKIGVSVESDLLNLEILTEDLSDEELLQIIQRYKAKKQFFRLKNGEFIQLEENESLEALIDMMDSMNVSLEEFTNGKLHLPLYRSLYIHKLLEEHDELVENRDKHFKKLVRNFNAVKDSDYEVPSGLQAKLRRYQEYGFKWLQTLSSIGFGGILADDMGLGKTIQIISFLLSKKENNELAYPALIVCPASLVFNWQEEFRRFAPDMKVASISGTQASRKKILKDISSYDALVTSYDLLKRDIGLYKNLLFSYEVLDEGQYIKNPKAAVSKAVKVIQSQNRFVLTGTPIENRLSELWSIFDYLMPGFLYSYDFFKTNFETPIVKQKNETTTNQLIKMVSPFILRRLKGEVLKDLPEKLEEVRYAQFDKQQRKLYDSQLLKMQNFIKKLDKEDGQSRIRILAELTKIRQICCDPSLLFEDYKGDSAKRQACMDLIQSAMDAGHRLLVFSQFTSMLEILEEELKKEDIAYYKITGSTPKEERLRLVNTFNADQTPVFLISLKAGGTGLNLVGADVVVHYDPWWNVAVQNQATDRAHRIGQKNTVTVYRLIVKDSIEEKVLQLQEDKQELADAILTGEHTSLTSLSKDELMKLLET